MSLSSSGGPTNSSRRPPTRNHSYSESSESSCAGSGCINVTAPRQFSGPDDSSSISDTITLDKVKRKKRRKFPCTVSAEKQAKASKKADYSLKLKKRIESLQPSNKLHDNRIPVVLLTRLIIDSHLNQPKTAQKEIEKTSLKLKVAQYKPTLEKKNDKNAEPSVQKKVTKPIELRLNLNTDPKNLKEIPELKTKETECKIDQLKHEQKKKNQEPSPQQKVTKLPKELNLESKNFEENVQKKISNHGEEPTANVDQLKISPEMKHDQKEKTTQQKRVTRTTEKDNESINPQSVNLTKKVEHKSKEPPLKVESSKLLQEKKIVYKESSAQKSVAAASQEFQSQNSKENANQKSRNQFKESMFKTDQNNPTQEKRTNKKEGTLAQKRITKTADDLKRNTYSESKTPVVKDKQSVLENNALEDVLVEKRATRTTRELKHTVNLEFKGLEENTEKITVNKGKVQIRKIDPSNFFQETKIENQIEEPSSSKRLTRTTVGNEKNDKQMSKNEKKVEGKTKELTENISNKIAKISMPKLANENYHSDFRVKLTENNEALENDNQNPQSRLESEEKEKEKPKLNDCCLIKPKLTPKNTEKVLEEQFKNHKFKDIQQKYKPECKEKEAEGKFYESRLKNSQPKLTNNENKNSAEEKSKDSQLESNQNAKNAKVQVSHSKFVQIEIDQRLQLPPKIRVPANLDHKIFTEVCVKVDKNCTENSIEKYKESCQNSEISIDNKGKKCMNVIINDLNKCPEKLAENSDSCDVNVANYTNNSKVKTSAKRLTRHVDKDNDKLSEKLIENSLKQTENVLCKVTSGKSQTKGQQSLISNDTKLKISEKFQEKDTSNLVEDKLKCKQSITEKTDFTKSVIENVKKLSEKSSQETDELFSDHYIQKKLSEISDNTLNEPVLSTDKKIGNKNDLQGRPKRANSKISEISNKESVEISLNKSSIQQKKHKIVQIDSVNDHNGAASSFRVVLQSEVVSNDDSEKVAEKYLSNTDNFSTVESKNLLSKTYKQVNVCSKNETEKKIIIKVNDKNKKPIENLVDSTINSVGNTLEVKTRSEKTIKVLENCTEKQTDTKVLRSKDTELGKSNKITREKPNDILKDKVDIKSLSHKTDKKKEKLLHNTEKVNKSISKKSDNLVKHTAKKSLSDGIQFENLVESSNNSQESRNSQRPKRHLVNEVNENFDLAISKHHKELPINTKAKFTQINKIVDKKIADVADNKMVTNENLKESVESEKIETEVDFSLEKASVTSKDSLKLSNKKYNKIDEVDSKNKIEPKRFTRLSGKKDDTVDIPGISHTDEHQNFVKSTVTEVLSDQTKSNEKLKIIGSIKDVEPKEDSSRLTNFITSETSPELKAVSSEIVSKDLNDKIGLKKSRRLLERTGDTCNSNIPLSVTKKPRKLSEKRSNSCDGSNTFNIDNTRNVAKRCRRLSERGDSSCNSFDVFKVHNIHNVLQSPRKNNTLDSSQVFNINIETKNLVECAAEKIASNQSKVSEKSIKTIEQKNLQTKHYSSGEKVAAITKSSLELYDKKSSEVVAKDFGIKVESRKPRKSRERNSASLDSFEILIADKTPIFTEMVADDVLSNQLIINKKPNNTVDKKQIEQKLDFSSKVSPVTSEKLLEPSSEEITNKVIVKSSNKKTELKRSRRLSDRRGDLDDCEVFCSDDIQNLSTNNTQIIESKLDTKPKRSRRLSEKCNGVGFVQNLIQNYGKKYDVKLKSESESAKKIRRKSSSDIKENYSEEKLLPSLKKSKEQIVSVNYSTSDLLIKRGRGRPKKIQPEQLETSKINENESLDLLRLPIENETSKNISENHDGNVSVSTILPSMGAKGISSDHLIKVSDLNDLNSEELSENTEAIKNVSSGDFAKVDENNKTTPMKRRGRPKKVLPTDTSKKIAPIDTPKKVVPIDTDKRIEPTDAFEKVAPIDTPKKILEIEQAVVKKPRGRPKKCLNIIKDSSSVHTDRKNKTKSLSPSKSVKYDEKSNVFNSVQNFDKEKETSKTVENSENTLPHLRKSKRISSNDRRTRSSRDSSVDSIQDLNKEIDVDKCKAMNNIKLDKMRTRSSSPTKRFPGSEFPATETKRIIRKLSTEKSSSECMAQNNTNNIQEPKDKSKSDAEIVGTKYSKNIENNVDCVQSLIEEAFMEKIKDSHPKTNLVESNKKSTRSSCIGNIADTHPTVCENNLSSVDEHNQKQLCSIVEKISQKEPENISENDFQINLNLATEFIESQAESGNFHETSQMCLDSFITSEVNQNLPEVDTISDVIDYFIENNELSSQISAAAGEKRRRQDADLLSNLIEGSNIHGSNLYSQEFEKSIKENNKREELSMNLESESLKTSNLKSSKNKCEEETLDKEKIQHEVSTVKISATVEKVITNDIGQISNADAVDNFLRLDENVSATAKNDNSKSLTDDVTNLVLSNEPKLVENQYPESNENSAMCNDITFDSHGLETLALVIEESQNMSNKNSFSNSETLLTASENLEIQNVNLETPCDGDSDSRIMHEKTINELKKKIQENFDKKFASSLEKLDNHPNMTTVPRQEEIMPDELIENTPDHENYPESLCGSVDSEENLADRLNRLNNPEVPPLSSFDSSDSGFQVTPDEQRPAPADKIVVKSTRYTSYLNVDLDIHCKDCDESFVSNRELKKHMKTQHRGNIVIKIKKTHENKHEVEPVLKTKVLQEHSEDDDENLSSTPASLEEFSPVKAFDDPDDGEIKMKIVKRGASGLRNTHIVKELKITPRSDRVPTFSPVPNDSVKPVKRRGRPRKYPIFTEAELIAKRLANEQGYGPPDISTISSTTKKASPDTTVENQTKEVPDDVEESLTLIPETTDVPRAVETEISLKDTESLLTDSDVSHTDSEHLFGRSSVDSEIMLTKNEVSGILENTDKSSVDNYGKRKRLRTLSQDSVESDVGDILNKKQKVTGVEGDDESDQSNMREKYRITKELVVQLTKIDTVSDENEELGLSRLRRRRVPFDEYECCRSREYNYNKCLISSLEKSAQAAKSPESTQIRGLTTFVDENQKAKILMLKNPNESSLAPAQPSVQPQFCILFIPDALYNTNSTTLKDAAPTATIVNFQPVPDSEIHTRPMTFTPTTPTKITAPGEQTKPFVCANCTKVLDLVGKMEASMGMEEDKGTIKCPLCPNNFQSTYYLEYHLMQEHHKCENEKQCRHSGLKSLRMLNADSEFEIYITFALKCRSCYDIFSSVAELNDHVMQRHKTLVRLKSSGLSPTKSPPNLNMMFKNGTRQNMAFTCPSDCICRIGIRSNLTLTQRQQMVRRCPNAMRYLEEIKPAAYEVYTCTLCKTTFLEKNEVVDHLMKMHEVSCKFPCKTCLTSFRTLQMQNKQNHGCIETTLQDLDKMLTTSILPTNATGKGGHIKYPMREDSLTEEYDVTMKSPEANLTTITINTSGRNGFKRKLSGALDEVAAKKPKQPTPLHKTRKKRNKFCPKCVKRFSYRKSLFDHIIQDHIMKSEVDEEPKNRAIECLRQWGKEKSNIHVTQEFSELLDAFAVKDKDKEAWEKVLLMNDDDDDDEKVVPKQTNEKVVVRRRSGRMVECNKCKETFKMPPHLDKDKYRHSKEGELLCGNCFNDGPKTRRRSVLSNGNSIDSPSHQQHPFSCKRCPQSFPTVIELNNHQRDEHSMKVGSNVNICEICHRIFSSERMLEKHKKMHCEGIIDSKTTESIQVNAAANCSSSKESDTNDSLNKTNDSSRRDSSDSSISKEPEKQLLVCHICDKICTSKVCLKNHLIDHGCKASICEICNSLLDNTSVVRHMLDEHIVPSKSNPRPLLAGGSSLGSVDFNEDSCSQEDVDELIRTLGKQRLQSLMMYHDFDNDKCNNAIMRCPICPELFATRESCRFHYVWIHDDTCLLCDETFRSGSSACQHKMDNHNSTASYLWCIQRLVRAIVNTLGLHPDQPSQVHYQVLAMKLDHEMQLEAEIESMIARTAEKGASEDVAGANLLEEVLSEDQLPDSGNMIEVVIGKEDSEDDLLSLLNLSPTTYESRSTNEQHILPSAGTVPLEEEVLDESTLVVPTTSLVPPSPLVNVASTSTIVAAAAPATTSSTAAPTENYVTSSVCKYNMENDEEQLVLVITDEDLVAFRDDVESLADRISATCDSLTLDEITEMLRAYFESVNANNNLNNNNSSVNGTTINSNISNSNSTSNVDSSSNINTDKISSSSSNSVNVVSNSHIGESSCSHFDNSIVDTCSNSSNNVENNIAIAINKSSHYNISRSIVDTCSNSNNNVDNSIAVAADATSCSSIDNPRNSNVEDNSKVDICNDSNVDKTNADFDNSSNINADKCTNSNVDDSTNSSSKVDSCSNVTSNVCNNTNPGGDKPVA